MVTVSVHIKEHPSVELFEIRDNLLCLQIDDCSIFFHSIGQMIAVRNVLDAFLEKKIAPVDQTEAQAG